VKFHGEREYTNVAPTPPSSVAPLAKVVAGPGDDLAEFGA
jgi:hypothetical protein